MVDLFAQLVARDEALELALTKKLRAFKTTEKVSPNQLKLLLETVSSTALSETPANAAVESEAEDTTEGETAAEQLGKMVENERNRRATEQTQPPPARPRRTPFPPNLPREDNPILMPDAERPCPKCGLERRCAGHDVSEVLELVPARVIVRRDLREKLACDACDAPNFSRAPVGDRVVQGGQYGPRLVAQLLVDKYRDGLPLHRQRERYRRMSVDLSVSTLADQVTYGAELLQPLWRAAQIAALKSNVLHLDGTASRSSVARARTRSVTRSWAPCGASSVTRTLRSICSRPLGTRHSRTGTPSDPSTSYACAPATRSPMPPPSSIRRSRAKTSSSAGATCTRVATS
ncbi:MAG: transposase [Deltaproteobacteria bacterium]|nr:transposase [Deltaproteobacteria bacterium]